jgi:hypothetical protein
MSPPSSQVPTVGREAVQVMTPTPAIAAGTARSRSLIDPD